MPLLPAAIVTEPPATVTVPWPVHAAGSVVPVKSSKKSNTTVGSFGAADGAAFPQYSQYWVEVALALIGACSGNQVHSGAPTSSITRETSVEPYTIRTASRLPAHGAASRSNEKPI